MKTLEQLAIKAAYQGGFLAGLEKAKEIVEKRTDGCFDCQQMQIGECPRCTARLLSSCEIQSLIDSTKEEGK